MLVPKNLQNSYMNFANEFILISTLDIKPTDQQYDVFCWFKGKIVNNVSYNIRGSYINERNRALFRSNDYSENRSNEDYAYGFQVVYDDMKTVSFSGDLKASFQTM
jgi:hypothetical protein